MVKSQPKSESILLTMKEKRPPKIKLEEQILVADDQVINLHVTKSILSDIGVINNCHFFTNGQETIDAAKNAIYIALELNDGKRTRLRPIVAILLDLQMPIKNGLEVIQETRQFLK